MATQEQDRIEAEECVERGLSAFGAGDVDGALVEWRNALFLDPDSERARSYLAYVEEHHGGDDSSQEATVELAYPFGVSEMGLAQLRDEDLSDYESFEIVEQQDAPTPSMDDGWGVDGLDSGWDVDESWFNKLREQRKAQDGEEETTREQPAGLTGIAELTLELPINDGEEEPTRQRLGKDVVVEASQAAQTSPTRDFSTRLRANAMDDIEIPDVNLPEPPRPSVSAEEKRPSIDLTAASSGFESLELEPLEDDAPLLASPKSKELGSASGRAPTHDSGLLDISLSDYDSNQEVTIDRSKLSPALQDDLMDLELEPTFDRPLDGPEIDLTEAAATPTGPVTNDVLASITAQAPKDDQEERTNFIVNGLIEAALECYTENDLKTAAVAIGHALEYAEDSALAHRLVFEHEGHLGEILISYLGDETCVPRVAADLGSLRNVDHRAAFLMTRIDGTLSLEEILDICGMPRLEALMHLSRLRLSGIIEIS